MMPHDATSFLQALGSADLTMAERAIALLLWHSAENDVEGVSAKQLADEMEKAGYAKQNITRLTRALTRDRRVRKVQNQTGHFSIDIRYRDQLWERYKPVIGYQPTRPSDSLVPRELVAGTRDYLERVVDQVNLSYDYGLYDCCAVICRGPAPVRWTVYGLGNSLLLKPPQSPTPDSYGNAQRKRAARARVRATCQAAFLAGSA